MAPSPGLPNLATLPRQGLPYTAIQRRLLCMRALLQSARHHKSSAAPKEASGQFLLDPTQAHSSEQSHTSCFLYMGFTRLHAAGFWAVLEMLALCSFEKRSFNAAGHISGAIRKGHLTLWEYLGKECGHIV